MNHYRPKTRRSPRVWGKLVTETTMIGDQKKVEKRAKLTKDPSIVDDERMPKTTFSETRRGVFCYQNSPEVRTTGTKKGSENG